jgi:hypothetical protein
VLELNNLSKRFGKRLDAVEEFARVGRIFEQSVYAVDA